MIMETKVYLKDLARMAGVHRVTLWRWLLPHRRQLEALGMRRGQALPAAAVEYICDWFVILEEDPDNITKYPEGSVRVR